MSTESKNFFDGISNVFIRIAVFFTLFVYEEIMFHLLSIGEGVTFFPIKILMCIPTALLFSLITMFVPGKVSKVFESILLGIVLLYYSINLMYHSAFKVYFSISLIDGTNAKIAQYYREIIDNLKLNSWKLAILILVPVAVYVILRNTKKIRFERVKIKLCFVPLLILVISIIAEIGIAKLYGNGDFSPYSLMSGENVSDFSFAKLGVLATAEIEIKNLFVKSREVEEEFEVWVYQPAETDGNASVSSSGANAGNSAAGTADVDGTGEAGGPEEIIIDTSPNMLDIDFVGLAEAESDSDIANIHRYFASVEPSYKNEYTGMFDGYNLIFLTCEAFCPLAVDEELTPTLYKLVNEGFVFTNFYNARTYGSTSDGEFVNSTSLVPVKGGATNFRTAGQNYMPFALGNMFNNKYGITSRAYHNNDYTYYDRDKTYPGMGYDYVGIGNGMDIPYSWPRSDLDMMEATIPDYIDDELFHVYYMTVSGHMNYNFGGNAMSLKHKADVEDLPYSEACKAYLACQMELDAALEYLLEQLEEKGIADRTVICFTGDHWPYGLTDEEYSELLGHEVDPYFELYKSNLVIWSGSMKEPIVVDKVCSSMDILPTLLNLFGMDFDSRLLMGRDILSDTEGFVLFVNRCFITDKVMYNSMNGQVIYLTGEELPDDYIDTKKELLSNRWKYSQKILDRDYYKYVL